MRETLEHELLLLLNGMLQMLSTVEQMLPVAADVLIHERTERLEEIRALDQRVDAQEAALEAECLKIIALHQPVARDLRTIALTLKSLSDIERMGDYAVHVAEDGVELAQAQALKKEVNLSRMLSRLQEMSENLRHTLSDRDVTRAELTVRMDDEVDELYDQIQRELVGSMLQDPQCISKALLLLRVGRSLERIGDHMENVAERVQYWVTGQREAVEQP